jgi:archaemetzincin
MIGGKYPMSLRLSLILLGSGLCLVGGVLAFVLAGEPEPAGQTANVDVKLRPLAQKLGKSEWLESHPEKRQTFQQYQDSDPVLWTKERGTIHLCLIGDFSEEQRRVLDVTREYMAVFFDVPVKVRKTISLKDIPDRAKRVHPTWDDNQILSTHILEVLKEDLPDDAMAYVAFTASDLWPGEGWNFVFGQASLSDRAGVWSIYRHGNPAKGKEAFQLCLKRTLGTASHETGHILSVPHCVEFECSMNGCNSLVEADRKPLHVCPPCLRKLCWNLQVEPVAYLKRLQAFYKKYGFADEAEWCGMALGALESKSP